MTNNFNKRAHSAISNAHLQDALHIATSRFAELRSNSFKTIVSPDALRRRARKIRQDTFDNIDIHLKKLIEKLEENGVHIHFANTSEDAKTKILNIAKENNTKTAVKSKSMASEELHLNEALEDAGIKPVETDLGEWILQLAHETPSHLVAPAIHKTLGQVTELFREKVESNIDEDPETLTAIAREKIRSEFLSAELGISGVNFAIAETGTISLVTNEGNARMVTTLPKTHIAIMGIEKIVPTVEDAFTLLSVLPRSATGQKITSYFTMITGAKKETESDGPEEIHLVVIDGGRTQHLGGPFQEAFHCIRCGACQNACPVFQTVGGHVYDSVYGGPIGSILTPMLKGIETTNELPMASSLCGACMDACPVMVDIPRMLLEMRKKRVKNKENSLIENTSFKIAASSMKSPFLWKTGFKFIRFFFNIFSLNEDFLSKFSFLKEKLQNRKIPIPAKKSLRTILSEKGKLEPKIPAEIQKELNHEKFKDSGEVSEISSHQTINLHGDNFEGESIVEEFPIENPTEYFKQEVESVGGKPYFINSREEALSSLSEISERFQKTKVAITNSVPEFIKKHFHHQTYEILKPKYKDDNRESIKEAKIGITSCDWAISETGTIVIFSNENQPRLFSLLPEIHICILFESQILTHLSELPNKVKNILLSNKAIPPSCINLITGPSRSADIALTPIKGVHGPKELHILILSNKFFSKVKD